MRYLNSLRFLPLTLAHFLQLCISFLFQIKILLLYDKLSHRFHAHNISFTNLPSAFDYSMKSLSLLYTDTRRFVCSGVGAGGCASSPKEQMLVLSMSKYHYIPRRDHFDFTSRDKVYPKALLRQIGP